MFPLFRKKDGPAVTDQVWMTVQAKFSALADRLRQDPSLVLVGWFEQTLEQFRQFPGTGTLTPDGALRMAEDPALSGGLNATLLFLEHHPLPGRERALWDQLGLSRVTVCSALDEPLFVHFGGEKITQVLKKMGLPDNEMVQNPLIGSAIRGVQDKIASQVLVETPSRSQQQWIENNLRKAE
ncbi:MAG TPA: hypothetical protein VG870_03310 [Chitinophagaceae bacterium]|nr:hypothetical protein [Chitinophagaceae bacterium]